MLAPMADFQDEKTVLVTGANGQDGVYLVERLAREGHAVHGMCHSEDGAARLVAAFPGVSAHVADLADTAAVSAIVDTVEPTHIFNLAGNTSVERSWQYPTETADVLGVGAVRLLDAAWKKEQRTGVPVRFLQASSAEIFGDAAEMPQNEGTKRAPMTPYGAAKSFAHEMVGVYRTRGMFASTAILYNHESPRRPESFVARKISRQAAKIALGLADELVLGNIDVYRDWGYAPDYVDAMVRVLNSRDANDFVVATGVAHTVRQFVEAAFRCAGITDWESHVRIDAALYRPADPRRLVGDPTRLKELGWRPSVDFEDLVRIMVESDLAELRATAEN